MGVMASIPELLSIALQHHRTGRLHEADAIYREVLSRDANQVDAWHLLGVIALEKGESEQAIQWIGRALALRPDFTEAHYNLGRVYQQQGKLKEAVVCYRRAIGLKADYAEAYKNLGLVRQAQGATEEALRCFRRMAELRPDYAEAHLALGNALKDAGQVEKAVACFRRALELAPSLADAENNLGSVHEQQGRLGEARACYRRAVALDPNHVEAHWNDAVLSLLHGEFDAGWSGYEWRWRTREMEPRTVHQPVWAGEPLAGRTILVHAEQGPPILAVALASRIACRSDPVPPSLILVTTKVANSERSSSGSKNTRRHRDTARRRSPAALRLPLPRAHSRQSVFAKLRHDMPVALFL